MTRLTRDSGTEELGPVPAEWAVSGLGRFTRLVSGAGFPIDEQGIEGEDVAFYKVNALGQADPDGVIREAWDTISIATAHRLRAPLLPPGTIVLAKIGAALQLGRIRRTERLSTIDNNMLAVVPSSNIDPTFLAYALQTFDFEVLTNPGAVPSLDMRAFRQRPVGLPPLPEQRAIADYLDRETAQIDAFIAKNEELITLLRERRAAIVSRGVAQGLNPDAPTAKTGVEGLGLVPAHWKVERFARVAKIRGGLLDPSDSRFASWALIAPNHIRSASGELLELVPASEQSAESGKYPIQQGDVVYSKIRPALAKAVIAPEDCLCSADMYGITSRSSDVLDNRYLRWQMLSKWFTEWATERSMRVAMPKVNQDTLNAAPIIVPPIEEQREIVEHIEAEIEAVDVAISVARRSVDLARERRAALISAAVTGKIDVGVAA